MILLCAALTYVLFGSFFQNLWLTWKMDPFYAHGAAIGGLSIFLYFKFIWEHRSSSILGLYQQNILFSLLYFSLFLFFFVFGIKTHLPFLGGMAFVCWFIALQCLWFDLSFWKEFSFPGVYFLWAVPLPYLSEFSGRLQIVIASLCASIIRGLGYSIIQDGIRLQLPNASFQIASDCTGIKSWLVLFSLASFFLYFLKIRFQTKLMIFVSLLPLAFVVNLMRVTVLILVGHYAGEVIAMNYWHDFSGIFFYGVSTLLILGISGCLIKFFDSF